jgi:hypothetical protein
MDNDRRALVQLQERPKKAGATVVEEAQPPRQREHAVQLFSNRHRGAVSRDLAHDVTDLACSPISRQS